jgi:hypothetical protein
MRLFLTSFLSLTLAAMPAAAGEAHVENVRITATGSNSYRFDVTVRHADEGWQHYADKWDVMTPEGEILGTRTLYHPHVDEQPFTRSLSGVSIPGDISEVVIRAHDSKHGYGEDIITVAVPRN